MGPAHCPQPAPAAAFPHPPAVLQPLAGPACTPPGHPEVVAPRPAAMAQSLAASSVVRAFLPQQQRCSSRQQRRMSSAAAPSGARRQAVVCSASIKFAKYQGLGNDFILVRGCWGSSREASGC